MTRALAPLPVQQFFDANGVPLTGGKLFTYITGTNTKLASYVSEAGAANTNPVILNARGEANIWLPLGTSYRFVLSPPTDTDPPTNPIWTVDDITSGPAPPAAATAASFSARLSADVASVTGDGTTYVLKPDVIVSNNGAHYSAGTGQFTAPVDGIYQFSIAIAVSNVATHTTFALLLVTTSDTIIRTDGAKADAAGYQSMTLSAAVHMAAGDTAETRVTVTGGAKNVGILHDLGFAGWSTWFSGFLAG